MKNFRKIFSCILIVAIILSQFCIGSFAASGTGTASNPYQITTAAQLQAINDDVTANYVLMADINLNGVDFTPIGNIDTGAFSGTFDGNGHKISGLNVFAGKYAGLFGCNEGTVSNVILDNTYVYGTRYVGGVVGFNTAYGKVKNCKNLGGEIESDGGLSDVSLGGICGYNEGDMNSSFTNAATVKCSLDSVVTSKNANMGGIIGYNCSDISLVNTSNSGELNSEKITGIYNNYNTYLKKSYTGGLIGHNSDCSINLENCYNDGKIKSNVSTCGGICGYNTGNAVIKNCYNESDIIAKTYCSYNTNAYSGGFFGVSGSATCYIENSFNNGEIYGLYAGGFSGVNSGSLTFLSCYNNGDITGNSGAGGFAGDASTITVNYSYNTGNVSGSWSGGFSGDCSTYIFNECFNSGNIQGNGFVYGTGSGTISNSYNTGNIKYGFAFGNYATLLNCYNSGNLSGASGYYSCLTSSKINSSYTAYDSMWNKGQTNSCVTLKDSEMKKESSFSGWDFDEVWEIDPRINNGYPILKNAGSSLTLNYSNKVCYVGENIQLSAFKNGMAANDLKWSVSDSLATVTSSGKVTASAPGVVTVSAIDSDGNRANCNIRIMAHTTSVTSSDFSIHSTSSLSSYYIHFPSDTQDFLVNVTSSNPDVVSVDAFNIDCYYVSGHSAGRATLTFETYQGLTGSCTVTVTNEANRIDISDYKYSIGRGKTYQFKASVRPDPTSSQISWSSSDTSIATVDENGIVTGISAGNARITVKTDNGYSAYQDINVVVYPDSLGFVEDEITMYVGETYTVTPDYTPLDVTSTINYSCSAYSYNLSYSPQNNGKSCLLTAKSTGTYTLTVNCGGLSDKVTVKVLPTPVIVTGITLNATSKSMLVGEMFKMTATVKPSDATDKSVTWVSSDDSIISVSDEGMVTAKGEGTATVSVIASNGVTQQCVFTITDPASEHLPLIYINDVDASDSEYFDIPVRIKNNPGICRADFSVSYNSDKVEPVSIRNGVIFDFVTSSTDKENGRVNLFFASDTDINTNGILAILRFKVIDFESGNADIKVNYNPYDIKNSDAQFVEFETDDGIAVISCSHNTTEFVNYVDAGCTTEGYTGDTYCAVCHKFIVKGAVLPAFGHVWSRWEVDTQPSMISDGSEERYCINCGITESQVIEKLTKGIVSDEYLYGMSCGILTENISDYFNTDYVHVSAIGSTNDVIGTGSQVSVEFEDVTVNYTTVIFGDVNGDGWYDGTDAMIVKLLANGMLTKDSVTEAQYMAADCNHDGVIDNLDVDLLEQAGILLANVDQSKSSEELLATSSAYVDYLSLIDQNVDVDEDSTDEPIIDNTSTDEPVNDNTNVFAWMIDFFVRIFNYIKLHFAILK